MNAQRRTPLGQMPRRGFTLTELLVVIMVIGILSSTMLFTMYGAVQQAKEARAQTQVVRLHELLMTRWDSYRTRPVRLLQVSTPGTPAVPTTVTLAARRDARLMATARLTAIRDLMRMEMPDRITDVSDGPVTLNLTYNYQDEFNRSITGPVSLTIQRPALSRQYFRRAKATWSTTYQGAECLYLIVASIQDATGSGLDVLQDGEIGDIDGDGMFEILDPWEQPIEFLRWAPGYVASPGVDGNWGVAGVDDDGNGVTDDFWEAWYHDPMDPNAPWVPAGYGDDWAPPTTMKLSKAVITARGIYAEPPDPFNPIRIDPKQLNSSHTDTPRNYALYPLIYSAGPDGKYEINLEGGLNYAGLTPPNNPYYVPAVPSAFPPGTPLDADGDGELGFLDNITNHAIDTR